MLGDWCGGLGSVLWGVGVVWLFVCVWGRGGGSVGSCGGWWVFLFFRGLLCCVVLWVFEFGKGMCG